MDERTIDQDLIGKDVRIVMNDGFIRKCTIVAYNDKVVKTMTRDGIVTYIPWVGINRITNANKGDINERNERNREQE